MRYIEFSRYRIIVGHYWLKWWTYHFNGHYINLMFNFHEKLSYQMFHRSFISREEFMDEPPKRPDPKSAEGAFKVGIFSWRFGTITG